MPDLLGRRLLRDPGPAPHNDDTPADPVEDHRLIECPCCGVERVVRQSCWYCGSTR